MVDGVQDVSVNLATARATVSLTDTREKLPGHSPSGGRRGRRRLLHTPGTPGVPGNRHDLCGLRASRGRSHQVRSRRG